MDRGVGSRFTTYTDVDVLLLCWAEWCDDLSTMEEVSRLRATFEERFNFHAQIKYLDTAHQNKLQVQVNTIVASFIGAHDGPSTLLIVYYAGHARPGAFYGSLVLYGFVKLALCSASLLILAGNLQPQPMERYVKTL